MALNQSALNELLDALRAGGDLDVIRQALTLVLQALIEAEAAQQIGASRYERTETRTTHRNGTRARLLSTKAGDVELKIPKLREGSFFPALLEPRRRIDRALLAVVMEAYVHGTSTRKVDDLVKALGVDAGISKSEVSRICGELDGEVAAFRSRSLAHTAFPYLFVDATYLKARVDGRVVSRAVVIATGVTADGGREVLGLDVGDSEDGAFWTAFLRSLKARGLARVQLVISDAHTGLKQAISAVMAGAAWQRCRVHFLRNVLARVPKASAEMVAAAIRTIFAQPTAAEVIEQLDKVAAMLAPKFPAVAAMLADAREELTTFASFPIAHWRKLWSTNPLERVNKEIKRRTNVVGIFPDDAAVLRLAGAVLIETHDEWQVAERRYLSEGSMALLAPTGEDGRRPKEVQRATPELVAT
ncbi:MAG: IS256 family transposase [Actinomycetota bacterium]|nr:IS256 family transposase [Actinomycetota bacterium]